MAGRVRRLAGDLPDCDSVWVDALAQARVLTAFAAAEINAGRGEALRRGPLVACEVLYGPRYAECYGARHVETRRAARLYVVRRPQVAPGDAERALVELVDALAPLAGRVQAAHDAGATGAAVWAACPPLAGTTAAQWMIENGRFPPECVLAIAREMLAQLELIHEHGVVHGDIGAAGLVLSSQGDVWLPMPGLRPIVRPCEGYAFGDLQPEAYDYLAPERIAAGATPSVSSDLYACGALWWHLLAGRAPLVRRQQLGAAEVGARRPSDRRATLRARAPEALAVAIAACMARQIEQRPRTAAEVAAMLGPATRAGGNQAAVIARRTSAWRAAEVTRSRRIRNHRGRMLVAAVTTAVAIALPVSLWPIWRQPAPGSANFNCGSRPASRNSSARFGHEQTGRSGWPRAASQRGADGRPRGHAGRRGRARSSGGSGAGG